MRYTVKHRERKGNQETEMSEKRKREREYVIHKIGRDNKANS